MTTIQYRNQERAEHLNVLPFKTSGVETHGDHLIGQTCNHQHKRQKSRLRAIIDAYLGKQGDNEKKLEQLRFRLSDPNGHTQQIHNELSHEFALGEQQA